jgi:integrase/recombinase XerD
LKSLLTELGEEKDINEITLHDLRSWRAALSSRTERWKNHPHRPSKKGGLSVESIYCHTRAAKRFFRWLHEEELITKNPALRLEKPELPKRCVKGLSAEDRDKLIEQAYQTSKRDYAIVLFLADTACRLGELANLKVSNIDFSKRQALVVEKGKGGGTERWVYFKERTSDALEEYLKERPFIQDDRVFLSTRKLHYPLSEVGIYQVVKRLALKAKVAKGWNPHNWRHGSIRGMLDHGMPLSAASQIAGHSSTKITGDIYGTFPEKILRVMHDKYSWLPDEERK